MKKLMDVRVIDYHDEDEWVVVEAWTPDIAAEEILDDVHSYMEYRPGDVVEVEVKDEGKVHRFTVVGEAEISFYATPKKAPTDS